MPSAASTDDAFESWLTALRATLLGSDSAIAIHAVEQQHDAIGPLDTAAIARAGGVTGWTVPDAAPGIALDIVVNDMERRDDAVAVMQAVVLAVELRRRREGREPTAYSVSGYAGIRRRVHAIRNSLNSLVMNAAVLSYEQRAAGNPFAARIDSDARDCSQALTGLVGALEPGATSHDA